MSFDYAKIAQQSIEDYEKKIAKIVEDVLAKLYSSRTHFIYELLQNAEDAGASTIKFSLYPDRLEIRHNGRKFNEKDVIGICSIAESTKTDNLEQIGKFGIGFKSVYTYTKSPEIYSGDESFCITNYISPNKIKMIDNLGVDTIIVLPFNNLKTPCEIAFNEIQNKLKELEHNVLLFINNIKEINFMIAGLGSGKYSKKTEEINYNFHNVNLAFEFRGIETNNQDWIVISKKFIYNDINKESYTFNLGDIKQEFIEKILVEKNNDKSLLSYIFEKISPIMQKKINDKLINCDEIEFISGINEHIIKNNNFYSDNVKKIDFEPLSFEVKKIISQNNRSEEETRKLNRLLLVEIFPDEIRKNSKIEIAYKKESGKIIDIDKNESFLSVYFPTQKKTDLKFLIQGPYRTTPARDNILQDERWNKQIICETAQLISDSIGIIKDLGLLNLNFLNIFPKQNLNNDFALIFAEIVNKLKNSECYLPACKKNLYLKPVEAFLGTSKDIMKLFDSDKIKSIFSGEIEWLDFDLNLREYSDLKIFIKNFLGVEEIDYAAFAEKINKEFLENQSDDWLIELYKFLDKNEAASKLFKKLPILRLESNSHIAPFNSDNKINAYMPSNDSSLFPNIIKKIFKDNVESYNFLSKIGIKEPDEVSEIKEFILPQYKSIVSKEKNLSHIKKIFNLIKKEPDSKIIEIINEIKSTNIFLAENINVYKKPCELYLSNQFSENDILEKFFENNESIYFLSNDYYDILKDNLSILKKLGMKDDLKITTGLDSYIEGLDHFLKTMNEEKALLLWELIIKNYTALEHHNKTIINETKLCRKLSIEARWLPNKNDKILYLPSELFDSDLPNEFDKESFVAKMIIEKFGFKKNKTKIAIDQIENDEDKRKCELALKLTFDELQSLMKKKENSQANDPEQDEKKNDIIDSQNTEIDKRKRSISQKESELNQKEKFITQRENSLNNKEKEFNNNFKDVWKPECDINDINVYKATKFNKPAIVISDSFSYEDPVDEFVLSNQKLSKRTHPDSYKKIGEYGEKTVIKFLKEVHYKEEYPNAIWKEITDKNNEFILLCNGEEIVRLKWVNSSNANAIARDIEVNEKGIEKYFEVKTGYWIMPSEKQWNKAKEMKDNYFICKVYNVGKKDSQVNMIQNPYKEWKDILENPYKEWNDGKFIVLPKVCL